MGFFGIKAIIGIRFGVVDVVGVKIGVGPVFYRDVGNFGLGFFYGRIGCSVDVEGVDGNGFDSVGISGFLGSSCEPLNI